MEHALLGGLIFAFAAASAAAQAAGPGLSWFGNAGGSAGSFFPTCTSLPVTALRGDTVTMHVWGDVGSPFVLGTAATATQCVPIPGFGNGLVLDLPASVLVGGLLTQISPCLSCPPGFTSLAFVVPATLPIGTTAAFQAVGFGNSQLAFTVAITATVQ
ncbi:MAG TPA: hypothetical protein VF384_00570 [Planctomycetota bacterium]